MRIELKSGEKIEVRIFQRPEEKETLSVIELNGTKYSSKSKCHGLDHFSKHKGLQLSLSRALKKAGLNRESRTVIWDKIFNHKYTKGSNANGN